MKHRVSMDDRATDHRVANDRIEIKALPDRSIGGLWSIHESVRAAAVEVGEHARQEYC
jgi:hypothetical protein